MRKILAIKGHATGGQEVIELLEMMGGNNSECFTGRDSSRYYFIDDGTKCICSENIYEMEICYNGVYILFSYDNFNDDYPWRIGDIVNVIGRNDRIGLKVVKMQWGSAYNTMMYCLDCGQDGYGWVRAEDIEYTKYSNLKVNLDDIVKNVEFDLAKYSYEVKDGKLIIEEKKPKYPKTYEKCCEILDILGNINMEGWKKEMLLSLQNLLICRDAYWKIAGEQMGLDKPWDSTYGRGEWGYWIGYSINENKVYLQDSRILVNHTLVFPTDEMRDAFYENFKDLINECKELL